MAALNTIARAEADTIREGIAWLIIWKTGRSWHAESVYLNTYDDTFEPEDLDRVHEILKEDPNAVMVNGYYCGYLGEHMTAAEIEAGLRWHYENGCNLLDGSTAFPPDPTECPENEPDQAKGDRYYINGQEWDGKIGEIELEPATADNEPEPLLKVPDNVTLELKISPEQAAAIVESLKPTIEKIKQAFRQVGEQLTQTFKKIVEAARKSADEYMDNLLYCANDNPRWWHLYKHAKKWRTRKKYRNKLMQQLRRKLAAEAVT